ncbi:hypothetical protein BX592_13035 [Paraburkholderia rhizosphaerae]|uniref:Uncharacterized protein n=2 Tax=Paraburkholderia rhizosphaerae TaxID=480658 RepID=A0A4R8L9Q7_9BURK|nr:hypothetical protein BX592_13035 [Paraburkholderia rhizosphaerae]
MEMQEEKRINKHDLKMVSFESNSLVRCRNAVIAIDTSMQDNYAKMKAALLPHLDPVIVVSNDDWGGTYTLIHNGARETLRPVSAVFELAKSISHTPLGLYVIIAPYLGQPDAQGWVPGIKAFRDVLQRALDHLQRTDLPHEGKVASHRILVNALRFIDTSLENGRFSIDSFDELTAYVHDDIAINMRIAGKAQVDGVSALLTRWKAQLGEKSWKNLYAVVLSIWTTMIDNQNSIIIRKFMDQKRVATHLIDISTAEKPADPIHVALDNLGRIVMDNVAAELVFPTDRVLADSLKGPQDLLSNVIEKILVCPHANRHVQRAADAL